MAMDAVDNAALRLLDESGLAQAVPAVTATEVADILRASHGLAGQLCRISTEKDDTFLLKGEGYRYLIKIASPAESYGSVEMQTDAMRWAHTRCAPWQVQHAVPSLSGDRIIPVVGETTRYLRVLTYIDGEPFANSVATEGRLKAFGRAVGEIDVALRGFSHSHADRPLVWNLENIPVLASLRYELSDSHTRSLAAQAFQRFEQNVSPRLGDLPRQMIHGDFSPYNIIVDPDSGAFVQGVIDFGDAMYSRTVFEPAVGVCNLLGRAGDDPWHAPIAFLAGYLAAHPLHAEDAVLIADAALARLALRAVIADWRARRLPDRRQYLESHAEHDWRHLAAALSPPPSEIAARIGALLKSA